MADDVSNGRRGPFVELGALHRLLDRLKPDDLECTSAWYSSSEPCCKEIVHRFRNLLNKWASDETRVEECLATDCNLTKCERCGVIRSVESSQVQQTNSVRSGAVRTIPQREQNTTLSIPPVRPVTRYTRKQEIMRNSHPIVPHHIRTNVPTPLDKSKMRNNLRNSIPKKLPTKVSKTNNEITNRSLEKNTVGSPMVADECSKKEYRKCDDDEAKNGRLLETVKYLINENVETRKNYASQGKHSFALHGSRDTNIHDSVGFFVYDRLKLDKELQNRPCIVNKEDATKIDSVNESGGKASIPQPKSDSTNLPIRGSDTSAFSSSSAENLIRQWIKPSWNARHVNAERKELIGMRDSPPLTKDLPPETKFSPPGMNNLPGESKNLLSGTTNLSPGIRLTARVDKNNERSVGAQTDKDKSNDRREIDEKTNSIKTSDIKTPNNLELPGISKAVANTTWNDRKISKSSMKSLAASSKTINKSLMSTITMMSSRSRNQDDLTSETSERFEREIFYDKISSDEAICESAMTAAASKVLLIYRKILESSEEMDWESFENLVSVLHPGQRELWCEICKVVSNEAKRLAEETGATTEVCIELNPLPSKGGEGNVRRRGDEISFELDMTLKDVRVVVENNCSAVSKKCK